MNAGVIAVATFVAVFLGVCGLAWLFLARPATGATAGVGERKRPTKVQAVIVAVAAIVVSLLAVVAIARVSMWALEPLLTALAGMFFVVFLRPLGALLLAVLALAAGLPFAKRFRSPRRFKTGVVLVALALGTFWPFQYLATRPQFEFREWNTALHILGVFVSVSLLSGGLETMRRANNTREDDSWEFWA